MNIEKQLDEIMQDRSGINFEENPNLKEQLLLGENIGLPVRELIMIYMDIEKIFKITVDEEYIMDGSFKTYQGILNMLKNIVENNTIF